jgi:hypothetical protein
MSIILDANLFLLLAAGIASKNYIGTHRRLRSYSVGDFDLLQEILSRASKILVTPNVLTEASNLAAYIAEPARGRIYLALKTLVGEAVEERYVESKEAVARNEFIRIGLTDCAILQMPKSACVVLTSDLNLYLAALKAGFRAENFNHLRAQ